MLDQLPHVCISAAGSWTKKDFNYIVWNMAHENAEFWVFIHWAQRLGTAEGQRPRVVSDLYNSVLVVDP